MRVVYTVPTHRDYIRSGSSSEPVLVQGAAKLWNGRYGFNPLYQLTETLDNGMLSRGDRGEIAARFIVLRAYDECIKNPKTRKLGTTFPRFGEFVHHCDFLGELFASDKVDQVLDSTPVNYEAGVPLQEAFADAWVRPTHFARAGDDCAMSPLFGCAALARGFCMAMLLAARPSRPMSRHPLCNRRRKEQD